MEDAPTGCMLISTKTGSSDDDSYDNLLFSYFHNEQPSGVDADRLKNLSIAVSGAGRAVCGQQVQTMLLSRSVDAAPLRIAFMNTKELLFVQLLPGRVSSSIAAAAALWLLHMLLFLLGPWSNWLQQQDDSRHGPQLTPSCHQQLLQLLPLLLGRLLALIDQSAALASLLLSVGLPAVRLPQQLQAQLWGKLQALQQQVPGWLPVVLPQQQPEQLMVPSCCLFYRGCLLLSSARPWLAQRLWGLVWALGLHARTAYHPPALLLQDAHINLAAAHALSSSSGGAHGSSGAGLQTRGNTDSAAAAAGSPVAAVVTGFAGGLAEVMLHDQHKVKVKDLQSQLMQQLAAFEAAAEGEDAEELVQPCTVVLVCLGPYTLVAVLDRLPAGAAAGLTQQQEQQQVQPEEPAVAAESRAAASNSSSETAAAPAAPNGTSADGHAAAGAAGAAAAASAAGAAAAASAAAGTAAVLPAIVSCLEQMLLSHGEALQQQLEHAPLPDLVSAAAAVSSYQHLHSQCRAQQQEQQQQQQQKQEQQQPQQSAVVTLQLPKIRVTAAGATPSTARGVSGSGSSAAGRLVATKSPRKQGLFSKLLWCGSTGGTLHDDTEAVAAGLPAAAAAAAAATAAALMDSSTLRGSPNAVSTPRSAVQGAAAATPHTASGCHAAAPNHTLSLLLSNPCTPTAALRAQQFGGSSGPLKRLRHMLSGGFSQGCVSHNGHSKQPGGAGGFQEGLGTGMSRAGSSSIPYGSLTGGAGGAKRWLGQSSGSGLGLSSSGIRGLGFGSLSGLGLSVARGGSSYTSASRGRKGVGGAAGGSRSSSMVGQASGSSGAAAAGDVCELAVDWQQGSFAVVTQAPEPHSAAVHQAPAGATGPSHTAATAATAAAARGSGSAGITSFTLAAAAAVLPSLQQLLPKAPPAASNTPLHQQQQQQQQRQGISTAGHLSAGGTGHFTAASRHHGTPAAAGSAGLAGSNQCTAAAAVAAAAAAVVPQPSLLPAVSLAQLERHAAVAGDVGGAAVLDADQLPWQHHPELGALLGSLQRIQVVRAQQQQQGSAAGLITSARVRTDAGGLESGW